MSEATIKLSSQRDSVGVNTEYGFAHIVLDDGLTVQCCLSERKDGNGSKKQIVKSDCGHNDGICGDVNEKAFKKYGEEKCMETLFYHMRKAGVKII